MLRLLTIELQKLSLNRKSKTLILVSFFLPFLIIIIASLKIPVFGLFTLELKSMEVFNFPEIWHINTYFASQFKFIFAIVIVSMISTEYTNNTIKQNLIDGLSKKEFILSKFYVIVLFSFISTCLIGCISLFIGIYYSSNIEAALIFKGTEFLIAYFIKLIGFFSLCLFFGILIKRSSFTFAFIFILYILEWLGYIVANLFFNEALAEKIQSILPLKSMYKLIDQPFQRIIISNLQNTNSTNYYGVQVCEIFIVLCWVSIFILLSFLLLKKRDL